MSLLPTSHVAVQLFRTCARAIRFSRLVLASSVAFFARSFRLGLPEKPSLRIAAFPNASNTSSSHFSSPTAADCGLAADPLPLLAPPPHRMAL